MLRSLRVRPGFSLVTAWLLLSTLAFGQVGELKDLFDVELGSGQKDKAPQPVVTARLTAADQEYTLSVRLELPEGYNTYSLDRSFSGHTRIDVKDKDHFGLIPVGDGFTASPSPKRAFDEVFGKEVEKHFGTVTWSRQYRLAPDIKPEQVLVKGRISYQACKDSCYPLEAEFEARPVADAVPNAAAPVMAQTTPAASAVESLDAPPADTPAATATDARQAGYYLTPTRKRRGQAVPDPLTLQFEISPAEDNLVVVAITMNVNAGFRTYALEKHAEQFEVPTSITVSEIQGLEPVEEGFQSVETPKLHVTEVGKSNAHEGTVTWTQAFRVTGDKTPGLAGSINYQICEGEAQCMPPYTVEFSLGTLQKPEHLEGAATVSASRLNAARVALFGGPKGGTDNGDNPLAQLASATQAEESSLAVSLLYAFLGGLILNVMPCVLPVISIKVLSFVHQAGSKPGRVFLLNAAYSVGVLAVFITLATLAVTLQLGWGAQNQSAVYNIVMVCVVFAMGLSLLGVFEIPIPGMMSSSLGGQHHQEGLTGAFLTGILATLLATPCTGPFMAPVLFWSVKQPTHITYLVWTIMGLGMASPYLLLGCFPKLVDLLPRPGNWMVIFKQFCGFVLMGTAVWLLNTVSGIDSGLVIPTLIMLVGFSLMLWMVGNLYNLSSTNARRWGIRLLSLMLGGPVVALGIGWAQQQMVISEALAASQSTETVDQPLAHAVRSGHSLPWEPFSTARLEELMKAGQPVLIDFTADWCAICKLNERLALNTERTANFINEQGFVTLMADFTRKSPEIREMLNLFGQDAVPLTVIIPAGQPAKVKLLDGSFSQSYLLEKLQEAVNDAASGGSVAVSTGEKTVATQP